MGFLVLVLASSVQLFGITEKLFKAAVAVSAVPAAACVAKSFKESFDGISLHSRKGGIVVTHDSDRSKRANEFIGMFAGLAALPVITYGVLRGRTAAGRLKAVGSKLTNMSKHRFVTQPSAEYIHAHAAIPRLLSLEQEGLKHTADLEHMKTELAKAHADATTEKDTALLNHIENRQADVEKYQHNVAQNLELTRGRISEQTPH